MNGAIALQSFQADLNDILSAFSVALGITENLPPGHARRAAYISHSICRQMGICAAASYNITTAALLHDIGVAATMVKPDEDALMAVDHAMVGYEIVSEMHFLDPQVCDFILWHHADIDGGPPYLADPKRIPLGSQIIYIADRIDSFLYMRTLGQEDRDALADMLNRGADRQFRRDVVEAAHSVLAREKFWLDYFNPELRQIMLDVLTPQPVRINLDTLEVIADTFARLIDNKSSYTHMHSRGVAQIAEKFAVYYGFPEEKRRLVKVTGLLHDIGKLAVPAAILDKPGKLTEQEFTVIKSHVYYTKRILSLIPGFDEVKDWAGNHHETLDGRGYPEGLDASQLSMFDRAMAVSDIYQALSEDRPYRHQLGKEQVLSIIGKQVANGKLCPKAFSALQDII